MYEEMPRAIAGRCTRKVPFDDWDLAAWACQTMMDPAYYRCHNVEMMAVYRCEICARLHTTKVVHKFDDENFRIVYRDPAYQEGDMAVSYARYKSLMAGMTSAAKKVYEAVPMQDQWSTAQVLAELKRADVGIDYRVVAGCLDTLVKAKLVRETGKDSFQRESVRGLAEREAQAAAAEIAVADIAVEQDEPEAVQEPEQPQQQESIMAKINQPAAKGMDKAVNPLDRLGSLATRVATMAKDLSELASDISDAAVDIQSQIDTNEANVAKLRQLQQLLKSLELTS